MIKYKHVDVNNESINSKKIDHSHFFCELNRSQHIQNLSHS